MTTLPPTPESVIAWHRECFRTEAADAPMERVKRFLEEALEAAQSGDLTRGEAHALVDYVFDRPRDPDIGKELGGVYTTAVILARAVGLDFWECARREFARCEDRTEEIRRKQAAKPDHVRGDRMPSQGDPLPEPESMFAYLDHAMGELEELLQDRDGWQSLLIDYHAPIVERVWRSWGPGMRLYLHCIHPCAPGEALLHPHPWPSAMYVVEGSYEMAIGYGSGAEEPPLAAKLVLPARTRYEMTEPDGWHYVRPLGAPVYTIMVTGRPWASPRWSPRATKDLQPLSPERAREIMDRIGKAFSSHGG